MWSHVICETLTGKPLTTVFPSDWSWNAGMNSNIGQGSITLYPAGHDLLPWMWRDITLPWYRTVVTCWNNVPQHAGLIMDHLYDRDKGTLQIGTDELRAILSRRTVGSGVPWSATGAFEVVGKSARGVARAIIARYMTGVGAGFDLPVVLPADEGGSISRRWPMYEWAVVEDMLTEIQNGDGGPDIVFRPRWSPTTGWLEWVIEIGSPALSGPTVEWVLGAPETPAIGVKQRTDGRKTVIGVAALGKGSDQDMQVGFAGGLGTFPVWLDKTIAHKSIDDPNQLARLAMGELKAHEHPTVQVTVESAPASIALPDVRVGSTIRLLSQGDAFIADGTHVLKVIGMSGGTGHTVRLETQ